MTFPQGPLCTSHFSLFFFFSSSLQQIGHSCQGRRTILRSQYVRNRSPTPPSDPSDHSGDEDESDSSDSEWDPSNPSDTESDPSDTESDLSDPSDPETETGSTSEDEQVPYFTDPIREADRLRALRDRRRKTKRRSEQRRSENRSERCRRERRDRRRERDLCNRSRENQRPHIIQIMIPVSLHSTRNIQIQMYFRLYLIQRLLFILIL